MSEILTINTEENLVKKEEPNLLSIFDDSIPLLHEVMPHYTDPLPNRNMDNLIRDLKFSMKRYGGLGLSANQCGIQARVFVIGTDQFQITCINPEVTKVSTEKSKDNEGCLSYPAMYLKIERPTNIEVEFTNEKGERKSMELSGLTARCFLHELDHLNGITFTELVGPVAIKIAKEKQKKMIKKAVRQFKK